MLRSWFGMSPARAGAAPIQLLPRTLHGLLRACHAPSSRHFCRNPQRWHFCPWYPSASALSVEPAMTLRSHQSPSLAQLKLCTDCSVLSISPKNHPGAWVQGLGGLGDTRETGQEPSVGPSWGAICTDQPWGILLCSLKPADSLSLSLTGRSRMSTRASTWQCPSTRRCAGR